jgi:hypothetical protein
MAIPKIKVATAIRSYSSQRSDFAHRLSRCAARRANLKNFQKAKYRDRREEDLVPL